MNILCSLQIRTISWSSFRIHPIDSEELPPLPTPSHRLFCFNKWPNFCYCFSENVHLVHLKLCISRHHGRRLKVNLNCPSPPFQSPLCIMYVNFRLTDVLRTLKKKSSLQRKNSWRRMFPLLVPDEVSWLFIVVLCWQEIVEMFYWLSSNWHDTRSFWDCSNKNMDKLVFGRLLLLCVTVV